MRPLDPKKREKILTTAIALFVKKGYYGATSTDLADKTKMSSAHMYTYFEDKEDLLTKAILRMKDEHTALSTEISSMSVRFDDERFIELFYEAQEKIYHRVRFIINCMLMPELADLFEGIDFNYSEVFLPYLYDWPEEQAAHTARALASISAGYFLIGDIEGAKAASVNVLSNARANKTTQGGTTHE